MKSLSEINDQRKEEYFFFHVNKLKQSIHVGDTFNSLFDYFNISSALYRVVGSSEMFVQLTNPEASRCDDLIFLNYLFSDFSRNLYK